MNLQRKKQRKIDYLQKNFDTRYVYDIFIVTNKYKKIGF